MVTASFSPDQVAFGSTVWPTYPFLTYGGLFSSRAQENQGGCLRPAPALNAQHHSVAAQSLGPPMGLNLLVGIQTQKQADHFNILWKDEKVCGLEPTELS